LLKTAFIQNKDSKDSPDKWGIDQKQLFLLKNFPTFTGVRGMYKGKTLTFLNHTGTLGNFGLFTSSGDMAFLTAQNVFINQQANETINFSNITHNADKPTYQTQFSSSYYRCKSDYRCNCVDCNYCLERKYIFGGNLPFFSSYNYALDVHEVIRELTYFNIGEVSCVCRRETNPDLYNYTERLIMSAFGYGMGEGYFNRDNRYNNILTDDGLDVSVILNHLELKYGDEK